MKKHIGKTGRLLVIVFIVSAFLAGISAFAPRLNAQPNVLGDAMELMNSQKFGEARKMLKEAIQKDPANELLWVSYDSCVRSEMLSKSDSPRPVNNSEPPAEAGPDAAAEVKASPGAATSEAALAGKNSPAPTEKDIDCTILEADFSGGTAAGDLACLLNETFKFVSVDGDSFLIARPKDKNAGVSFSFNISKFPKKVKLILNHRLVKKDRFLSAAPLLIELNESKVNYDSVKLGNKLDSTEYDITNLSKAGANILTLSVENSRFAYLLKNVKVMLYFKD